jgi:hypothetical protein
VTPKMSWNELSRALLRVHWKGCQRGGCGLAQSETPGPAHGLGAGGGWASAFQPVPVLTGFTDAAAVANSRKESASKRQFTLLHISSFSRPRSRNSGARRRFDAAAVDSIPM